jgi:non-ribosomal peptide synthetase component F
MRIHKVTPEEMDQLKASASAAWASTICQVPHPQGDARVHQVDEGRRLRDDLRRPTGAAAHSPGRRAVHRDARADGLAVQTREMPWISPFTVRVGNVADKTKVPTIGTYASVPRCHGRQAADAAGRFPPDNEALVYSDRNLRWNFRELETEARLIARGLIASGVERGDRVAVWATNVPEWIVLQFALAKIGAILVTVNTSLGRVRSNTCSAKANPRRCSRSPA